VNNASADDAEVEACKAEAYAALKAFSQILKTPATAAEKREKLNDAYAKELHCADCIGRRSVEAFDQNPRSARTVNMADTSLNFLDHTLTFFKVARAKQIELGFTAGALRPSPGTLSNMQRLVALYHPDRVRELKKSFQDLDLPINDFDKPFPMPSPEVPKWFPIAGVLFGALTLLFFMALVGASLFKYQVPSDSRFSVVVVLAFGAALSGSFLGGSAAASGNFPLPFAKDHPISFSAGGGVAILVIVFLIGHYAYMQPNQTHTVTRLGSQDLQESANWNYDSVVIPKDTVIQTNGHDVFLRVKDDLTIEDEAIIRAFDYDSLAKKPSVPVHGLPGTDGLTYTGGASSTGAQGRDGGDGGPGQAGRDGISGKSAGKISLAVDGTASGALHVLNGGTNGQPGGDGGVGGRGGNGEGGGPGSGTSLAYPAGRHMGSGGKGGNGGKGGGAGRGGDGGSGGAVAIEVAQNRGFVLKELAATGGKSGTNGNPGLGGAAGQPGGGHGNRGSGRAGERGSVPSSSPDNGNPGKIKLVGVEAPK
jgi:hypothetical protein